MSWELQVKVKVDDGYVWRPVKPSGNEPPYEYPTQQEAVDMLWRCYPGLPSDQVRVKEKVDDGR